MGSFLIGLSLILSGMSSAEDVPGTKPLPSSLGGYSLGAKLKGNCSSSDPKYDTVSCEFDSERRVGLIRATYSPDQLKGTSYKELVHAMYRRHGAPFPQRGEGAACLLATNPLADSSCVIWKVGNKYLTVFEIHSNDKAASAGATPSQSIGIALAKISFLTDALGKAEKAEADRADDLLR